MTVQVVIDRIFRVLDLVSRIVVIPGLGLNSAADAAKLIGYVTFLGRQGEQGFAALDKFEEEIEFLEASGGKVTTEIWARWESRKTAVMDRIRAADDRRPPASPARGEDDTDR